MLRPTGKPDRSPHSPFLSAAESRLAIAGGYSRRQGRPLQLPERSKESGRRRGYGSPEELCSEGEGGSLGPPILRSPRRRVTPVASR